MSLSIEEVQKVLEKELPSDVMLYPFSMDLLKVSERVRVKCQVPVCHNYGVRKVCPPNMPPVAVIREAMQEFKIGFIIVKEIAMRDIPEDYQERIAVRKKLDCEMLDLVSQLENALIGAGCDKTLGLGAGGCPLCEKCTPPGEPCRHPFKARPGPSAMGIDITELAQKVGIKMEWPPKEKMLIMSMLFA